MEQMRKIQEVKSIFAIVVLAVLPGFLYILSLRISNILFHASSFNLVGDFSIGIIASILLFVITCILDVVFRRLKITGVKEAVMTATIALVSMLSFTFIVFQQEKQAVLTSLLFTCFSFAYAYAVKTRYEKLSADDDTASE